MSTPADAAREGARNPDGKFGSYSLPESNTDVDLGGPGNPSVPEKRDAVAEARSTIGSCPDCGGMVVGKVGEHSGFGDVLAPGTQCRACHHFVGDMVREVTPDDEEGTSHEYRLDEDGEVRVTDDDGNTVEVAGLGSDDWDDLAAPFGVDHDRVERVVTVRNDPYQAMQDICTQAGLADMAGVYDVILDRDRVPLAHVLTQGTDDVESHHAYHISEAIDTLASDYSANAGDDPDPSEDALASIDDACDEAGLGSMKNFYGLLVDRECLSDEAAWNIDADTVTRDYEQRIEPAIDRVEQRMLRDYRDSVVESQMGDLTGISEDFGASAPGADSADLDAHLRQVHAYFESDNGLTDYARGLRNAPLGGAPERGIRENTAERLGAIATRLENQARAIEDVA